MPNLILKGPKNGYRVVAVDTFDGVSWVTGDYFDKQTAFNIAQKKTESMFKMYVYDDKGKLLGEFGNF